MKEVDRQLAIIRRSVTEIISEAELAGKIERSLAQNKPLRIKYGIDPTAPDLHLGHSVPIRKLRDFQLLGHKVLFLVGDFTALVGDPTGRSETRPMLSPEQIRKNLQTYQAQIHKLLDLELTEFVFNSTWLAKLDFNQVIKLAASFTVAQMLEREDFSRRYRGGSPISLQEFLYPLMQGYDSVALESDVEIGATEQKFNLLAGRTLQELYGQEKQVVITSPILEGTDGVRKMSKTYGNYIPVGAEPPDMFGKLMSIPDNLMEKYFRCLTDLPEAEIRQALAGHPREAKEKLARDVVRFYYGPEPADNASLEFSRVFSQKKDPTDPVERSYADRVRLSDFIHTLAAAAEIPSVSEGKRLLKGGGVKINGVKVTDGDFAFEPPAGYNIRIGKLLFLKLVYKPGK